MLKVFIILIAILNLTPAWAMKGCKLNDLGHNICANERALYKIPSSRTIIVVEVQDHQRNYTLITMKGKQYRVNINLLVGNVPCADAHLYCRGNKAVAIRSCDLGLVDGEIKILESFENEMSLVQVDRRHHYLVRNACLTIVN